MIKKSIVEIEKEYELEIPKIMRIIKKKKAQKVLLQFPDGLKPYSTVIANEIENKTGCNCMIWLGDCFGACDVPLEVEKLGVDLIVQFGHSKWNYEKEKGIEVL